LFLSRSSFHKAEALNAQKLTDIPQGQVTIHASANRLLEQGFGPRRRCSVIEQAEYDSDCFKHSRIIRSCYDRLRVLHALGARGIRCERMNQIEAALPWTPLLACTIDVEAIEQQDAAVRAIESFNSQVQAQLVSNREKDASGRLRLDGDEIIDRTSMIAAHQQAAMAAGEKVENWYAIC